VAIVEKRHRIADAAPLITNPRARERHVKVAVVVPCYNVEESISRVIDSVPSSVWRIVCVDDSSRDGTGRVLEALARSDSRVQAVRRPTNGGVGAAFLEGMAWAIANGADVVVKLDGDGQMNGAFVDHFANPIVGGEADFVKGNRFFDVERVLKMPRRRLIGNAGLSFLSKLSTGYWNLFDPTNGYFAIHADVARLLPAHKLHKRYFFESDLLFRLAILRAVVVELPIETVYGQERSGLSELRCLITFPFLHLRNFYKRIVYNYFIRAFSLGSLTLVMGCLMATFGIVFGIAEWIVSFRTNEPATSGTVMLSALPTIIGIQLILNFLAQDVASTPKRPIHAKVDHKRTLATAIEGEQGGIRTFDQF
jgi:dolichol-phosphate mannosyltransferase